MSDTFYEESVFKKHWTWWPTMFCSMMHSMLTWHDMSYTKINKEGLITYVFKFRRGKRIHTALQMSRSKKLKIIIAERFISHHELAVLNSQHASIQSTSGILTKTHAPLTTIITEFKQSKNYQKSLCVNKWLTPPTPLSSSPIYPTLRTQTVDKLCYLVAMAKMNCKS